MNNFEQKDEIFTHLRQVANNLMLIVSRAEKVTPIERDLILQSLREAYIDILQMKTGNEIAETAECEKEPIIAATPAIPVEKEEEILPTPEPAEEPTPEPIEEPAPEPVEEPLPQTQDSSAKVLTELTFSEDIPSNEETILSGSPIAPTIIENTAEAAAVPEETIASASAFLNESGDILDFLGTTMNAAWTMPEKAAEPQPTPEPIEQPAPIEPILSIPAPPQPTTTANPLPPTPSANEEKPINSFEESLFPNEPAQQQPAQKKSLHEILTQQHEDNSLAAKYQHSHIDDLSKAISINDKFSFIKELFKGKSEDFSRAIQKLNSCNSLDEATSELGMMKRYYSWDTSSNAYQSLCDLVKRKFI